MQRKRLNLDIRKDLYDEMRVAALEHDISISDFIRKAITLLMYIKKRSSDSKIIVKEGDTERELVVL